MGCSFYLNFLNNLNYLNNYQLNRKEERLNRPERLLFHIYIDPKSPKTETLKVWGFWLGKDLFGFFRGSRKLRSNIVCLRLHVFLSLFN